MATKKSNQNGQGCAVILGITILVFTFGWPLIVFRHHWTSSDGVDHSAISAAGWIAEVVWLGVLAGSVVLFARSSARKSREDAVTKGTVIRSGKEALRVHDVIDPSLPRNDRNLSRLAADQLVKSSTLDLPSRIMLARAQKAIKDVLGSKVYADDQLERAVAEPTLRRHEWAAAVDLREITNLREEQAKVRGSYTAGDPGPLTKAVIEAQQEALSQKLDKIESIVDVIEKYAEHVKAADGAREDWQSATELSKLNTKFTDLVAGTGADEVRLREVEDMSEAANAYRQSLTEAYLAAKSLFLPDTATGEEG